MDKNKFSIKQYELCWEKMYDCRKNFPQILQNYFYAIVFLTTLCQLCTM